MLLCRGCFLGSSVVDATPTRTPLFIGLILLVVVAVLMVLLLWLCCADRIDMTAVIDIRDSLLIQQPFLHAYAHAHASLHHPNIHRHRHTFFFFPEAHKRSGKSGRPRGRAADRGGSLTRRQATHQAGRERARRRPASGQPRQAARAGRRNGCVC